MGSNWFEDQQDLYTYIRESIEAGGLTITPTDAQLAAIARYRRCQEAYTDLVKLFDSGAIREWQYKRMLEPRLTAVQAATRTLRMNGLSPDQAEHWLTRKG